MHVASYRFPLRMNLGRDARCIASRWALGLSVVLTLCACGTESEALTAEFSSPGGDSVQLVYHDERNFRLSPARGGIETIAVDGLLHLRLLQSDGTPRIVQVGRLPNDHSGARVRAQALDMAPTRLPRDTVITWGLRSEVYDAVWADHGSATAITRLTIAESPALAQAQAAVADGLGRGMTMDLCANAVREVVKAWPIAVTSEGYAVLASASGVRMRGTVRRVPRSPLIPDDVVVERVGI